MVVERHHRVIAQGSIHEAAQESLGTCHLVGLGKMAGDTRVAGYGREEIGPAMTGPAGPLNSEKRRSLCSGDAVPVKAAPSLPQ